MRKLLVLGVISGVVACGGSSGPPGPAGPAGAGTPGAAGAMGAMGAAGQGANITATISDVQPRRLFLDRELDVIVLGEATGFTGKETLDFGPGVTVTTVTMLTATALQAHVKIDKAATPLGPRDLKVTGGATMIPAATKIFSVDAPVVATTSGGMPIQGGVAAMTFHDDDLSDAFGNTYLATGGLFAQGGVSYLSATDVAGVVLFEPLGTPGKTGFILENVSYGAQSVALPSFETAPDAVTLAAASPTVLTNGVMTPGVIANKFTTGFYKFTAPANGAQVVDVKMFTSDAQPLRPLVFGFGPGGKLADFFYSNQNVCTSCVPAYYAGITLPLNSATPTDIFVVATDNQFRGGSGTDYGYTMVTTTTSSVLVTEQGGAHGAMNPQAVGAYPGQPVLISGSLSAPGEIDVYQFSSLPGTYYDVSVVSQTDSLVVGIPPNLNCVPSCIYGPSIYPTGGPGQPHGTYSPSVYNYSPNIVVANYQYGYSLSPTGTYLISVRQIM